MYILINLIIFNYISYFLKSLNSINFIIIRNYLTLRDNNLLIWYRLVYDSRNLISNRNCWILLNYFRLTYLDFSDILF